MLKLQVTGMTCSSCARTLETALKDVAGVRNAEIDYREQTATIDGDPDTTAVLGAIQNEGYQATVLAR
jgi:copper chaperone